MKSGSYVLQCTYAGARARRRVDVDDEQPLAGFDVDACDGTDVVDGVGAECPDPARWRTDTATERGCAPWLYADKDAQLLAWCRELLSRAGYANLPATWEDLLNDDDACATLDTRHWEVLSFDPRRDARGRFVASQ